MRLKFPLAAALVAVTLSPLAPAVQAAQWPSLATQVAEEKARPGSALEKYIAANQDFSVLRADEATDQIGIPLWLRVAWRKAHPENRYSAADAAGGYPRVLNEVHEWLVAHPNMRANELGIDFQDDDGDKVATAGTNVRISGAATTPRSESDIRINFLATNQVIAASNNIGGTGRQLQYRSTDGGATWGTATQLPLATGDSFHSDPAVDWTSDGVAWSITLGINSAGTTLKVRAYKSTDGGVTWTLDGTPSGTQTNTDKELMWVDHSASSAFRNNIYVCWHNGNPAYVGRRTTAWQTPVLVSGAETTGTAIGCDIKTNSAGDVFVFWPDTGSRKLLVRKSTTGGASFTAAVNFATTFDSYDIGVPSFRTRRALIYTAGAAYKTATKNLVYATWTDLTGATGCTTAANEPGSSATSACKTRIWFARSTDGGATWGAKKMINNQAGKNDQFNQFIAVDESNGKVGIIYYDTVNDTTRLKTDIYYQSSSDDGVTFSTPLKVTTVQTNETIAGADSGNQYGDYNSLSGILGKFLPSWTDRRSGAKEEVWTAPISDP